jgi:hypothetical protein
MDRKPDLYPVDVEPMPHTSSYELPQEESESLLSWMFRPNPDGFFYQITVLGFKRMRQKRRAQKDPSQPLNAREQKRLGKIDALQTMSYHAHNAIADTTAYATGDINHSEKLLQGSTASQFEHKNGIKYKTAEGSAYADINGELVQVLLPGIGINPENEIQAGLFVPLLEPQRASDMSLSRKPKIPQYHRQSGYENNDVGLEIKDATDDTVLLAQTYTEDSLSELTQEQLLSLIAISNKVFHGADKLRHHGLGGH